MVALPAATPVTTPVVPTVAVAVLELDQTPPEVVLLKGVEAPTQTALLPVTEGTTGKALTVIVRLEVLEQPLVVTV